MVELKENFR